MRKWCFTGLGILLLSVLLAACDSRQSEPLRVGTSLWPGYEPLFLAKNQSYFGSGNVVLVEYPVPSGAVRAMVNGAIQAAALTMDEVLKIVELGVPVKVVLVMDISEGGDVILSRPSISSVMGLKGRKVAMEGSVLAQYMLGRALELNNMTRSDVQIVNMDATRHADVFAQADIDAVVTYDPARTQLIRQGAKSLFSSSDIPGEIVDVLVVREEYLEKNPEVVNTLIDGWYASLAFLHEQPEQAAEVISKRLRITPKEVLASYEGIRLPSRESVAHMLAGEDVVLMNGSKKLVRTMYEQGLLKTELDTSSLYTAKYLR